MRNWKWIAIAAILMIDVVLAYVTGLAVEIEYRAWATTAVLIAACHIYARRRGQAKITELAVVATQLIAFSIAITLLMYMLATLNFPLVDKQLAAADRAVGFDWLSAFNWFSERPALRLALKVAYDSILPQVAIVLVALNVLGRMDRMHEFVTLYFITALITVPISAVIPAASAWAHFGVVDKVDAYHLAHLTGLRDGTLKTIVLADTNGIITFPSFHTTLAIVYIYVTRSIRWLWPVMLVANLLMIAAVPTEGGHYMVDVIGGAIVTAICILAVRVRQERGNAAVGGVKEVSLP